MKVLTDYHAKYFAYELTRRCPSDSVERIASTLMDSQVDLNPHQVDAALFAFRSPLSKGALLADEVGLGKTIEAGIVLAQKWAERKRKILLILPSSLRKQWVQELQEKFYLPSRIMEGPIFNKAVKAGAANPFDCDEIVICSYQFARNKAEFVKAIGWDLVVIDEAHRLRNVYKAGNKIARELKWALADAPTLLLTATPLQNSLLELFGLVSFIDEHVFGDLKSYKAQFSRLTGVDEFTDLKERLNLVCKRTLRRQVREYINYTQRRTHTQDFIPTPDEETLYEMVSDYLCRPNLMALPASQRSLMTLILRKLLASSTFAIAGALNSLANKLERRLKEDAKLSKAEELFAEDVEQLDELREELGVDEEEELPLRLTDEEKRSIQLEIADLRTFYELAMQITQNAKGDALLQALETGFAMDREHGGSEKAVIFTESRRTQNYVLNRLSENGYQDKIVLFNGSNSDPIAKQIYADWKAKNEGTDKFSGSRTADTRAALVEHFRDHAQIMIATEAAAEGINLQFCSLVVNYDLPWNPQRIEQRIGRCHRYGQKHDVVVVNFLNRKNAADQRVLELLSEKFHLFKGVFGASDEVLGAIESGVDFEQRIVEIYQSCRTPEQIKTAFDSLQEEMGGAIDETLKKTRQKLLEHFDTEVGEKLRVYEAESREALNRYEALLWRLTRHQLDGEAEFDDENLLFSYGGERFSLKSTVNRKSKIVNGTHHFRLNHPLSQRLVEEAKARKLEPVEITFDYTGGGRNISILKPLIGKSGTLTAQFFSVSALEAEETILFGALTTDGEELDQEQCKRLFDLPGSISTEYAGNTKTEKIIKNLQRETLAEISARNAVFFDEEMEKLDKWAEDVKKSMEIKLKQLDLDIKIKKADARKAGALEKKVLLQRQAKKLEGMRNEMRRNLFQSQDEVDQKKETLLETVEAKLEQQTFSKELMRISWKVT